jgi:hypothetical protein
MQIIPAVSAADVPFGAEGLASEWISVNVPGLGVSLAAVIRPTGAGPCSSLARYPRLRAGVRESSKGSKRWRFNRNRRLLV